MKRLFSIIGLAALVASCNPKYDKTPSGLAYKIIKGNGKEKIQPGQILKINAAVKIASNDSVLFSTYGRLPEYLPFDTAAKNTHDFTEVLKYCSVGDSLITIAQVDTLVKRGGVQYNDFLKRRDQIVTSIRILQVMASDEAKTKDQQAELEKEKSREIADVQAYITKNKIKAQKLPSGVFVEVTNPGNANKALTGKQVSVMYKGSLMTTGKVFDSNLDTAFHHTEPLSLVMGSGQVIPAWEEALPYFGEGGSGRILVPALMAYGPGGKGPIPPYSNLVFDVTVKSVTDAPKQQPQQQMDPRMLQQLQEQMQQQQQQQGQQPPQGQGQPQQPPR
ncbi:hypothetical protein EXU57_03720 [Segetibacter sp. 3557_3]|uniref:FKBP-type peptidyl-prolyl cis-trans isomerase n=1 Tax=Segetibacter sp. 3557_3 TaxID=2547429 RepID=UPI0010587E28|nr:FKBP-type peptidyl-prolyl cis-trans isomerase [Segetibacter sp. 3557_3]TDH29188.1 hypothetical protein EXU57_03720 [Segetibacter sp. 3557_3]